MNSVLEYVRQLNQQAVSLRNEWLDRLRHVECEPGSFSLAPEIAFTKKPGLRASDSSTHQAPFTVVSRCNADSAAERAEETPNSHESAAELTKEPVVNSFDSPVRPYCPMDQLRQLLGEELHVFSGSCPEGSEAKAPKSSYPPSRLVVERVITPSPLVSQPVIPAPHVAITNLKSGNRDVPESTLESSYDSTPVASVPNDDDADTDSSVNLSDEFFSFDAKTIQQDQKADLAATTKIPREVRDESGVTKVHSDEKVVKTKTKQIGDTTGFQHQSIDRITDHLLARFPVICSATVMFASLTPGVEVDTIAAKVATCLANRDLGGILLIDGNSDLRELTSMMGASRLPGLTDVVNRSESLSNVVNSTDNGNLEFLAFGSRNVTHRRFDASRATALNKEFNQAFQYTIVSGGVVASSLVQQWAGFVDAVYLLIDLKYADRRATLEALTALRQQAVRIGGIIAVEE